MYHHGGVVPSCYDHTFAVAFQPLYIYYYTPVPLNIYIYYYTPLPLNLANKQQATTTTTRHRSVLAIAPSQRLGPDSALAI